MLVTMMKAKLHRATVTQADLEYEGSMADEEIVHASKIALCLRESRGKRQSDRRQGATSHKLWWFILKFLRKSATFRGSNCLI